MRIKEIDQFGEVVIKFSESLILPSNATEVINEKVLYLSIHPANPSLLPQLEFNWKLKSFEANQIAILLEFAHPEYISSDVMGLEKL